MANKRTHPARGELIDRLRQQKGLALETLADKAGIHVKSLRRLIGGGEAYLETITLIAEALGVTPNELRADVPQKTTTTTFSMMHSVEGVVESISKIRELAAASTTMQQMLDEAGISVTNFSSLITAQQEGDAKRTIALIYGRMDNGTPFYVFAAVKPSRYELFIMNYQANNLDIHNFDALGEIIVIGEGTRPPDEMWGQIAEMYSTDEDTLRQAMKDEGKPEDDAT